METLRLFKNAVFYVLNGMIVFALCEMAAWFCLPKRLRPRLFGGIAFETILWELYTLEFAYFAWVFFIKEIKCLFSLAS